MKSPFVHADHSYVRFISITICMDGMEWTEIELNWMAYTLSNEIILN